ncbi:MAG: Lrp/AsnC family transcriptional regulator [Tuberibacillus sp.]
MNTSLGYNLDELDMRIMKILQNDGRTTFKDIANQVGVAERTVKLRVEKLKDNDILQVIGVVNPINVGLKLIAMIQIAVEQTKMKDCIEQLERLNEVRFIALTSGEYHLLIEVVAASHEEFGEFIEHKLNQIPGIRKSNITMELKIIKNKFNFIKEHGK